MEKPGRIINTYHHFMVESFAALRQGLACLEEAQESEIDDHITHSMYVNAGMQCRYAFLLAANALEAAANALMLGLNTSKASYKDMEKLSTLLKCEVFCLAQGQKLDRSNDLYGRVREIVKCRNEFVHPKPKFVPVQFNKDKTDFDVSIPKTKKQAYPLCFEYFEPTQARDAIGDILGFLAWIIFDVCKFELKEGVRLIGHQTCTWSGSLLLLGAEYKFDLRTFDQQWDAENGRWFSCHIKNNN